MLNFVINPTAGGKRGKKMLKSITLIENRLIERQVEYAFHYSEKKGDATKLTKTLIQNGASNIIAVGGDGTLHEVINGFSNFENVALGIIPCGTGNDFANALNLPLDPKAALDVILDNQPKFTDFMQMPTVRGLNIIGMGIDVDVLKRYESLKKKTKFGYTSSLIKTLFKFKCIKFGAKIGDTHTEHHSFIAGIANGKVFGGGLKLCPLADPCDGKLNFVTVDAMNKLKIINAFIQLKKGKLLNIKQAHHTVAEEVEIIPTIPYTVNVDGELYENIPFNVKVVTNTLRIYRV